MSIKLKHSIWNKRFGYNDHSCSFIIILICTLNKDPSNITDPLQVTLRKVLLSVTIQEKVVFEFLFKRGLIFCISYIQW